MVTFGVIYFLRSGGTAVLCLSLKTLHSENLSTFAHMKNIFWFACLMASVAARSQWAGNTTPDYPELIAYYQQLDRLHPEIELYEIGKSDTEWPLYVCIINGAQDSVKTFQKAREKTTVLINNAIHAGEPDGVNACLIWLDNWIKNGKKTAGLPVIAIIPAYNVGGMFNRSSTSRANQEGPEDYGFRGNSQNLDLNRDFIKMDAQNTVTFAQLFQALDPDVFVDTHVSNGADYQYTLTYIASMKERMSPAIRTLTYSNCIPFLEEKLRQQKTDLFPYIELKEDTPEQGIVAFNDLPRYAMGYASLFHTVSFTVETHMLKPFPARVEATRKFLDAIFQWSAANASKIEAGRREAVSWSLKQRYFRYNYALTEKRDSMLFKGFAAVYKQSAVSGLERLSYDRKKPYNKFVPYYGTHVPKDSVLLPKYYVVSSAATDVIRKLEINGVAFRRLAWDSVMALTVTKVMGYETVKQPYEGHYLHYRVQLQRETDTLQLLKGSIIVPVDQERAAFILSVLEPGSEDSYFAWNHFDSYLQQKEHFSAYVFEDKAAELLARYPALKKELMEKKASDAAFAANAQAQLNFIYQRSAYFEKKTVGRLPVFRVN